MQRQPVDIPQHQQTPDVDANHVDHIVASLRAAAGLIPFAGPIIGEAIGYLIPNQRIDRLAQFAWLLDAKLASLDQEVVTLRSKTPEFLDLFEDSIHHAVRALSVGRLNHITALLANSLSDEEQAFGHYKYLLSLLTEVTDTELIILHTFWPDLKSRAQFLKRHEAVLTTGSDTVLGSPQEAIDRYTITKDYRAHLVRLNLLRPNFKQIRPGELPAYDMETGGLKSNGYRITPLGNLLLRAIHSPDASIAQDEQQPP